MKKIIFYQSNFCQIGGVETMAYNWCWWLRNFFDVTVLYCSGDSKRIKKMANLVKMEKYDSSKEYECDIFIRNSVWGLIPTNIKAKRMIEMRHANYKYLLDKGLLYQQYHDMGIKEIVGCGEFVSKMSNEVLHDNPTTIKNILMPKRETKKVLHLISCTRLDSAKGWNRMIKMMDMMRNADIKFTWDIFTNSPQNCGYEEVRFWKQRYDIWDYLADADYTVLLSDSEGLPYTIQESLQYKVPCIVTDVGGCTELIKEGINGYVVPLNMQFDINKITNIPICEEYDNNALEDWLKFLGYEGKVNKQQIIESFNEEEEKEVEVIVKALPGFLGKKDAETGKYHNVGDEWKTNLERAQYLVEKNAVEIVREVEEEKPVIVDTKAESENVTPLGDTKELEEVVKSIEPKGIKKAFKKATKKKA